ncbi:hypothetical protein BU17DRAFT_65176 [Hysterangium stoloniferum]|nr:hypothetical protein BU17DRAFT_65176 [Hysterangium stoloniferum]
MWRWDIGSPDCRTAWLGGVDGGVNWDSLSWWCSGMEMDDTSTETGENAGRGGERERETWGAVGHRGDGRYGGTVTGENAGRGGDERDMGWGCGDGQYGGTVTGENAGRGRERERDGRDGRCFVIVSTTASSITMWCLSWSGDERYRGTVTGENRECHILNCTARPEKPHYME